MAATTSSTTPRLAYPIPSPFLNAAEELSDLYALIYPLHSRHEQQQQHELQQGGSSGSDLSVDVLVKRTEAVASISALLNRAGSANCPHAIESTALLLQAHLLDRAASPASSSSSSALLELLHASDLHLRSSYSLALLRFVNNLLDTLQTSQFARPIRSLAQEIDLPLHFVELRHAATHGQLPGLAVLREACERALEWLRVRYWWPAREDAWRRVYEEDEAEEAEMWRRQQPQTQEEADEVDLGSVYSLLLEQASESLQARLRTYRRIAKSIAKDASIRGRSKHAMQLACADIARWVRQFAETITEQLSFQGRDAAEGVRPTLDDGGQRLAILALVSHLLEPGGLVPLSKAKRCTSPDSPGVPLLPRSIGLQWAELLSHLHSEFGSLFLEVLIERLTEAVIAGGSPSSLPPTTYTREMHWNDDQRATSTTLSLSATSASPSRSYQLTAAAWLARLLALLPLPLGTAIADAGVALRANGRGSAKSDDRLDHLLSALEPSQREQMLLAAAQGLLVGSGRTRGPTGGEDGVLREALLDGITLAAANRRGDGARRLVQTIEVLREAARGSGETPLPETASAPTGPGARRLRSVSADPDGTLSAMEERLAFLLSCAAPTEGGDSRGEEGSEEMQDITAGVSQRASTVAVDYDASTTSWPQGWMTAPEGWSAAPIGADGLGRWNSVGELSRWAGQSVRIIPLG